MQMKRWREWSSNKLFQKEPMTLCKIDWESWEDNAVEMHDTQARV